MITTTEDYDRALAVTIAHQLTLARRYLVEVQALALRLLGMDYCAPVDFIREARRCQLSIEELQSLIDIPAREE